MNTPPIVSPQDWEAARQELLVEEKELTRARDALAAKRRWMPWMAVDKDSRGAEHIGSTWSHLDITVLGRQEEWEDSPDGYPQTPLGWWNYHDAYGEDG